VILSIESSCDDSAIALTRIQSAELVYHKRVSQIKAHSPYGGVVPELAARLHTETLPELIDEIMPWKHEIKAVAFTNEPGLVVSLIEGVSMAKAIAIALNVPLIPINHIKGHIYSVFIENPTAHPMSALVMSGGHTQLFEVSDYDQMRVVGATLDDSVGEAFDKVAKMMQLGYPGGPIIEQMASLGDAMRFSLTIPMRKTREVVFSYSGMKNGVRLILESLEDPSEQDRCDIAASFQKCAFDHIFDKLKQYLKRTSIQYLAIVGGVSANGYFRKQMEVLAQTYKIEVLYAPLEFCSDNAAMIGRAALEHYHQGRFAALDTIEINSRSRWTDD